MPQSANDKNNANKYVCLYETQQLYISSLVHENRQYWAWATCFTQHIRHTSIEWCAGCSLSLAILHICVNATRFSIHFNYSYIWRRQHIFHAHASRCEQNKTKQETDRYAHTCTGEGTHFNVQKMIFEVRELKCIIRCDTREKKRKKRQRRWWTG